MEFGTCCSVPGGDQEQPCHLLSHPLLNGTKTQAVDFKPQLGVNSLLWVSRCLLASLFFITEVALKNGRRRQIQVA